MARGEAIYHRVARALNSGATRITIEPKPDGDDGGLKFMVFIRSKKPGTAAGHSVCPKLATALERALTSFEEWDDRKTAPKPLDDEALDLL